MMVRAVLCRHEGRGFVDSDHGGPTTGNVELQIDRFIVARYPPRQAAEWAVISNSCEKQNFCAATLSTLIFFVGVQPGSKLNLECLNGSV